MRPLLATAIYICLLITWPYNQFCDNNSEKMAGPSISKANLLGAKIFVWPSSHILSGHMTSSQENVQHGGCWGGTLFCLINGISVYPFKFFYLVGWNWDKSAPLLIAPLYISALSASEVAVLFRWAHHQVAEIWHRLGNIQQFTGQIFLISTEF